MYTIPDTKQYIQNLRKKKRKSPKNVNLPEFGRDPVPHSSSGLPLRRRAPIVSKKEVKEVRRGGGGLGHSRE